MTFVLVISVPWVRPARFTIDPANQETDDFEELRHRLIP